ncbi:MAG: hypothetical protein KDC53_22625 [Saprospiraceae bacterium]|nr:hypothetical protein [Saprospiraceae bacterium]
MNKTLLALITATVWISISEFFRNEFLLSAYWRDHYQHLGMEFPSAPINGAIWGVWSLCFAIVIYIISRKFSLIHTTMLSWFAGFCLMWIVTGNMNVLPFGILPYAIPLSFLETYLAALIIFKFKKGS